MKSFIYSLFYLILILLTGCNGDSGILGAPELGYAITELQVTPATALVPIGFHQQYQAHAILEENSVIDITTNPALSWRSSNSAIVTIDSTTGIATGVTEGIVTITAYDTVNGLSFSETVELTVTDARVTSLQITPISSSVAVGLTQAYTATVILSDNSVVDVTDNPALSWSSSDTAIATIDNETGIATGISPGTVIITATVSIDSMIFSNDVNLVISNSFFQLKAVNANFFGDAKGIQYHSIPNELAFPDVDNPTGVKMTELNQFWGLNNLSEPFSNLISDDIIELGVTIDNLNSDSQRDAILFVNITNQQTGATIFFPMVCTEEECLGSYSWQVIDASEGYNTIIFKFGSGSIGGIIVYEIMNFNVRRE